MRTNANRFKSSELAAHLPMTGPPIFVSQTRPTNADNIRKRVKMFHLVKKHITLTVLLFILTATAMFAQTGSLEATVISRKGNLVALKLDTQSGDVFENGTVADMSKYFEEKLGNMQMSGWLGVAKVEFVPTTSQNVSIKILEEKGEITVNDEKVDHFKPGKRMKLEWPAKEASPSGE
jgi:hypothetical protein